MPTRDELHNGGWALSVILAAGNGDWETVRAHLGRAEEDGLLVDGAQLLAEYAASCVLSYHGGDAKAAREALQLGLASIEIDLINTEEPP